MTTVSLAIKKHLFMPTSYPFQSRRGVLQFLSQNFVTRHNVSILRVDMHVTLLTLYSSISSVLKKDDTCHADNYLIP